MNAGVPLTWGRGLTSTIERLAVYSRRVLERERSFNGT